ncbi:MarR family winged helix-turn-helix transcriptional regulator [uncultured Amnibacterium sp.]|uniref:MarR family winged helix-turn-helix transcriptional regulator n=1 Tax=uncultured Amnibacterium sp. TaxID=1631851 RepID=UPI0035C97F73
MSALSSPESALFTAMARFLHGAGQAAAAELASFGLTPAQLQTMVRIAEHPGIAQWQLAGASGVTKGNVSQLVKKLEQAGLVERVRNQGADELAVSPAGAALLDRVVPAHGAFMERTFAALDAQERDLLHALVLRLIPADRPPGRSSDGPRVQT